MGGVTVDPSFTFIVASVARTVTLDHVFTHCVARNLANNPCLILLKGGRLPFGGCYGRPIFHPYVGKLCVTLSLANNPGFDQVRGFRLGAVMLVYILAPAWLATISKFEGLSTLVSTIPQRRISHDPHFLQTVCCERRVSAALSWANIGYLWIVAHPCLKGWGKGVFFDNGCVWRRGWGGWFFKAKKDLAREKRLSCLSGWAFPSPREMSMPRRGM